MCLNPKRSEDMFLYKIVIAKDNSWEVMNELGRLNFLHFLDMNKDEQVFKLTYADTLRRVEETYRRIM
jgi:hypothetical protein